MWKSYANVVCLLVKMQFSRFQPVSTNQLTDFWLRESTTNQYLTEVGYKHHWLASTGTSLHLVNWLDTHVTYQTIYILSLAWCIRDSKWTMYVNNLIHLHFYVFMSYYIVLTVECSRRYTCMRFVIIIFIVECSSGYQCMLQTNETVCMPSGWRCDNIYHCADGKDELSKLL